MQCKDKKLTEFKILADFHPVRKFRIELRMEICISESKR